MAKKALLMILDGWGIGKHNHGDVIYQAPTPFMDHLNETYPHSQLLTCGENVGLPDGQMGNSEVGHLNIGAGRIVYQDLVKSIVRVLMVLFFKILKSSQLTNMRRRTARDFTSWD